MLNNDVIRSLRYSFDFNDNKMIEIFNSVEMNPSKEQIVSWLKKETDPQFIEMKDEELSAFLNGFIIALRGRKDGPLPVPEKELTNNIILRKLKIALDLKDDGVLEILALADLRVSKFELSALFRRPDHRNYRLCRDQFLRNFLKGIQLKMRP